MKKSNFEENITDHKLQMRIFLPSHVIGLGLTLIVYKRRAGEEWSKYVNTSVKISETT
jgi:hypothetical protein